MSTFNSEYIKRMIPKSKSSFKTYALNQRSNKTSKTIGTPDRKMLKKTLESRVSHTELKIL